MSKNIYDVLIVGGGISGTALFYELAEYTDLSKIALVEKYDKIAPINSNAYGNSQTLHCGDIETNYTFEKAKKVKVTANMVVKYCKKYGYLDDILTKVPKMALGVGKLEVAYIRARAKEFSPLYPYMRILEEEDLAKIEPSLVYVDGKIRNEPIVAMGTDEQYSAIDFGKLANSFVQNAKKNTDKECDVHLNTKVEDMKRNDDGIYTIKTDKGNLFAKFVVVNAGAHSLYLAHKMGYGLKYSALPIAGSFYYAPLELLKSKVYTIQNEKLPFAAVHGDPDIMFDDKMRFGPTALPMMRLERFASGTFFEFLESFSFDKNVAEVLWSLFKNSDIMKYIFINILYEAPILGKYLFLLNARKIIPSLKYSDLTYAKNAGGLRPQVIDKIAKRLILGEASIQTGRGLNFNMTPSPGATSCLGNAKIDVEIIAKYLKCKYDAVRLIEELIADSDSFCRLPEKK